MASILSHIYDATYVVWDNASDDETKNIFAGVGYAALDVFQEKVARNSRGFRCYCKTSDGWEKSNEE